MDWDNRGLFEVDFAVFEGCTSATNSQDLTTDSRPSRWKVEQTGSPYREFVTLYQVFCT